ncbi:MAG: hypothetical protein SWE60_27330, partial [Thermodesulfobacteriota bacterium]|nr:hypothetical protein [Thermodesulfobacteriota bacterium]
MSHGLIHRQGEKSQGAGYSHLQEALRKRTRELNCLYTVLEIVNRSGLDLEQRLQQIADALPLGWHRAGLASARVVFEGKTYRSNPFSGGPCRQVADLIVNGCKAGMIEVRYGKEGRDRDEGPFLRTDRDLINAIGKRISRFIERRKAEQEKEMALKKLQEALTRILSGFLPICAKCKKIRDDKSKWVEIEAYIRDRTDVEFSHSICPTCAKELYPDLHVEKM